MEGKLENVFTGNGTRKDKLRLLFADRLNRLHCIKSHVVERLADVTDNKAVIDLKSLINEVVWQSEEEIAGYDKIYKILGLKCSYNNCTELINSLEDYFSGFQFYSSDLHLSYILILSYLYVAEGAEKGHVQILKLLAGKMGNREIIALINNAPGEARSALMFELLDRFSSV
jgi:hypothetical protein